MRTTWRRLLAGAGMVLGALLVQANGFGQPVTTPTADAAPGQVARFAKKVERAMAREGARVALVARVGRPASEMPEGIRYTHVGFAVYSIISTADGRTLPGYAMYNLYQKNGRPDVSELVQDFPSDFFSGVAELEAGIIVPGPDLQQRLLQVIGTPTYVALHDPRYSVIANPYTLGRQNCTEFILDVIEASLLRSADPALIKARLKDTFSAQPVKVNPLRLLLGAMTSAEVALSDQPGPPVTATFETIARFLQQLDPGTRVLQVRPDGGGLP
jgi:hypothetical protein